LTEKNLPEAQPALGFFSRPLVQRHRRVRLPLITLTSNLPSQLESADKEPSRRHSNRTSLEPSSLLCTSPTHFPLIVNMGSTIPERAGRLAGKNAVITGAAGYVTLNPWRGTSNAHRPRILPKPS
jgi:hypothetical protein